MNVRDIALDVSKERQSFRPVVIGQGDSGGTTIRATVYDDGAIVDLSGMTARFMMRLPGGAGYMEDGSCTVDGGVITYVVDETYAASRAGSSDDAYFAIYAGGERIYSTSRFSVKVLRAAADGAEPAEPWVNLVDRWLERATSALDELDAASRAATTAATDAATYANTEGRTAANAAASVVAVIASAREAIESALAAAAEARGAVAPEMSLYLDWCEDEDGDLILSVVDTTEE